MKTDDNNMSDSVKFLIGLFIFWIILKLTENSNEIQDLSEINQSNLNALNNVNSEPVKTVTNPVNVSSNMFLEIFNDYTVTALDSQKQILVENPVKLSFSDTGIYQIIVRAYPVTVRYNNGNIADLDAGQYFIKVSNGTISIL